MTQAILYARFSPRPDQDESKSNEKQIALCRVYCSRMNYEIADEYSDKAVSGKTLHRPGLSKALFSLRPGMVLVVSHNDRLARDLLVALTIRQQVKDAGCTIEFADGSPTTETAEGTLLQDILAAFSSYERERIALRTKDGMARKKAAGVWCGRPPYGWRKIKGQNELVKDEVEQEAIRLIQHESSLGFSSDWIADFLNAPENDVPACRGKPWSARSIRRILARKSPVA